MMAIYVCLNSVSIFVIFINSFGIWVSSMPALAGVHLDDGVEVHGPVCSRSRDDIPLEHTPESAPLHSPALIGVQHAEHGSDVLNRVGEHHAEPL